MSQVFNNDGIDTAFVDTQLESVMSELTIKYPETAYSSLMPVDTSDDDGADYVGYYQYDVIGSSEIVADGSQDVPSMSAFATKVLLPVYELGNKVEMTFEELAKSRKAGVSLDQMKFRTSAMAIEQHHDDIAILGDGTKDRRYGGMTGIVFNTNVTKMASPKAFASATNDEILGYFASMVSSVVVNTKQVYRPDTFAMDDTLVTYLRGRIISGTSVSLWDMIKSTYSDFTFKSHYKLKDVKRNPATLALQTTQVILCYKNDRDVFAYKMPRPYRLYGAVQKGRGWEVHSTSKSAGVEVRIPPAIVVFYGI